MWNDRPAWRKIFAFALASLTPETGRLVIRPSGTEPLIRVMAEGEDESLVNAVVSNIVEVLKAQAA